MDTGLRNYSVRVVWVCRKFAQVEGHVVSRTKSGPSLRAQLLGQELSNARRTTGKTMQEAAEFLQVDTAKISRMESATYPARKAEVLALLDFYTVSNERDRQLMIQLTDDIWRKGWWDGFRRDIDQRFVDYPWLEARAVSVKSYEVLALSGLMQTRAYASTVIKRAEGAQAEAKHIERFIDWRMTRQQVLGGDDPKNIEAVIDESALRRLVGGPEVMKRQLSHLRELAVKPNVTIRVLPMELDWHPGFSGPFTIFEMPEPYPDVAYAENFAGRAYVEETEDVERFRRAYDELRDASLSISKSTKLITSIEKEL